MRMNDRARNGRLKAEKSVIIEAGGSRFGYLWRYFLRLVRNWFRNKKAPSETRLFFVWLLERDSNPRPDG